MAGNSSSGAERSHVEDASLGAEDRADLRDNIGIGSVLPLADLDLEQPRIGANIEEIAPKMLGDDRSLAIWGGRQSEEGPLQERLIDLSGVLASAPQLSDGPLPPKSLQELGDQCILAAKTPEHL